MTGTDDLADPGISEGRVHDLPCCQYAPGGCAHAIPIGPLARHVRDVEVGGSNPLSPTLFLPAFQLPLPSHGAALGTKVLAYPAQTYVHGIIPSYATIEHTSGCLPFHAYASTGS